MELIEQLEESIIALTAELKTLRGENTKLRVELGDAQSLLEQNIELEASLLQEKELRNNASRRIEKLLLMVRENLTPESEA